uniref:Penicillin-binding protein 1B n=1 Tax=Candidatus Aschnera chinzeii TaxID=1485666 RepID=A0AAT9G4M7_9ENTR|nr:MAG: penicillin-binding protein 1B [Candidatus Aschnera chinzeii]
MIKTFFQSYMHKKKWHYILIILIIIILIIGIYGLYLYNKINNKLNGTIWELPINVYSKIIKLEIGSHYNQNEIIKLLNETRYKKVNKIAISGDYSIKNNTINILRRAFNFQDKKENIILAQLTFKNNKLIRIINLNNKKVLNYLYIEPTLITTFNTANNQQRIILLKKDFPNSLIQMLLETEDRYFYKHDGIHISSIIRAIIANYFAGKRIQGGSTLTQQLVKNLFLNNKKTLIRKFNEMYMAILLSFTYSKERILELYLNEVYFGKHGNKEIHGFPLASIYYFNRPINEINIEQQALLVGMVKGASLYNPWNNPNLAIQRRNIILKVLVQRNILNDTTYKILKSKPLQVTYKKNIFISDIFFTNLIKYELITKLGKKLNKFSGFNVFTTLDPVLQQTIQLIVNKEIKYLKHVSHMSELGITITIINRINGEINAILDNSQPKYYRFKTIINNKHSIGSIFDIFTYLTLVNQPKYFQLNNTIFDKNNMFYYNNNKWQQNTNNNNFYTTALINAFINAISLTTNNIRALVNMNQIYKTLCMLGISIPKNIKHLSINQLYSLKLTPIENAQMFQIISNNGIKSLISIINNIYDYHHKKIYQHYPSIKSVISPQASYLTMYFMQKIFKYKILTIINEKLDNYHIAGVNNTNTNMNDSWFIGIDGKNIIVIWVGKKNKRLKNNININSAVYLYKKYIKYITPAILTILPPHDIQKNKINKHDFFNCTSLFNIPIWKNNKYEICKIY